MLVVSKIITIDTNSNPIFRYKTYYNLLKSFYRMFCDVNLNVFSNLKGNKFQPLHASTENNRCCNNRDNFLFVINIKHFSKNN